MATKTKKPIKKTAKKVGRKPVPVKKVKKPAVAKKASPFMNKKYVTPEAIESEQEVEFDGHDDGEFGDIWEDEPEHEGA